MDGINKIIEKIISDGNDAVEKMMNETRAIIQKIEIETTEKKTQLKAEMAKKTEADTERFISIESSNFEVEKRNTVLACKQSIMEQCYSIALDRLVNLEHMQFSKIYHVILMSDSISGDEEVLFSKAIERNAAIRIVTDANHARISDGKKGELTVSEETADIKGGMVLRSINYEIDYSYENLLAMVSEKIEIQLAEMLFEQDK